MKINVRKTFVDLDGNLIKDDSGVEFELRKALLSACVAAGPPDVESVEQKVAVYRMLQRINSDDEVDLSSEEITLLKKLVAKIYPVYITGCVVGALED